MATKPEFAAYVLEQLGGERHGIVCRRMFGEYGLHCYGKFFAVICDNTLFLKPTQSAEALLRQHGEVLLAPPYNGARDYFQLDNLDDTAFLAELVEATVNALPEPKLKTRKTKADGT